MEISHLGHSCFRFRGKNAILVTDPFSHAATGMKMPKTEADIVTVSHNHSDHNAAGEIEGEPVVISGPGDYEIKGVRITGLATFHDEVKGEKRGRNIMYAMAMEGLSLVHCGDLGHVLSDEQEELFTDCDVLFVPVGGVFTIDAATAAKLIAKLTPKIIVPMHYRTDALDQKAFGSLAPVSDFLKEMGKHDIVAQPKLVVTKDKLPVEQTIVVLE